MIVKQLYYKQNGFYKHMIGYGIYSDTLKTLMKGATRMYHNILKPRAIELGKQLWRDNKDEIPKMISQQVKSLISKKSLDKEEIKNLINKNKNTISDRSQEALHQLMYGEGLKMIPNK